MQVISTIQTFTSPFWRSFAKSHRDRLRVSDFIAQKIKLLTPAESA
jgi:hypothetical protein